MSLGRSRRIAPRRPTGQGWGADAALAASVAASDDCGIAGIDGDDEDIDDAADDGDAADGDADGVLIVSDAGAAGGVAVVDGVTTAGGGVDTTGAISSFLPQALSAAAPINAATSTSLLAERRTDDWVMESPWYDDKKKF